MLRSLGATLGLIAIFAGLVYLTAHQLVATQARVQRAERDIEMLRDDIDELRVRIDAPLPPPAPPTRPGSSNPATVYAVPVSDAPTRGPSDALVTVVAFTDYQCPFCGRVESTLAQLRERYPEDVRVVVQQLPLAFHKHAFDAAVAAECAAEQGQFWPLHDRLFERQRELSDQRPPAAFAEGIEGLRRSALERCTASERARAKVTEDQRLAERFGVRGTPSFFINGRFLSGAQPLERFAEAVERELTTARVSGIARGEYYRRAVLEKGALGVQ